MSGFSGSYGSFTPSSERTVRRSVMLLSGRASRPTVLRTGHPSNWTRRTDSSSTLACRVHALSSVHRPLAVPHSEKRRGNGGVLQATLHRERSAGMCTPPFLSLPGPQPGTQRLARNPARCTTRSSTTSAAACSAEASIRMSRPLAIAGCSCAVPSPKRFRRSATA